MFADAVAAPAPAEPFRYLDRPQFRFIDLFAGIGGIRKGLESAGGRCVFTVEIDKFAKTTYAANFDPVEAGDIRKVLAGDLPTYDVLAGGFPCQPFSLAGVSKKLSLGRQHGFGERRAETCSSTSFASSMTRRALPLRSSSRTSST